MTPMSFPAVNDVNKVHLSKSLDFLCDIKEMVVSGNYAKISCND